MRLCTVKEGQRLLAGVLIGKKIVTVNEINNQLGTTFSIRLDELIQKNEICSLRQMLTKLNQENCTGIAVEKAQFAAPYLNPPKIWGIGLNYPQHAADLNAQRPEDEPASFMKPATTIIGPGDMIQLPPQSQEVTGEAEIGVIIGQECKNVKIEDVPSVILGYTTIIDMTAVDILQRNPRYLTRSKSFDTFFSFGPWIVTPDEIEDLRQLRITTLINGKEHRSNIVGNMTFPPHVLVSFHSKVMTFKPGDIISCGTPGAAPLHSGDIIGCRVSGIGYLENPVGFWFSLTDHHRGYQRENLDRKSGAAVCRGDGDSWQHHQACRNERRNPPMYSRKYPHDRCAGTVGDAGIYRFASAFYRRWFPAVVGSIADGKVESRIHRTDQGACRGSGTRRLDYRR